MTEKRPLKEERALKPSPLDRTIAALRPAAGDAARIEARWLIEAASGDEAALAAMVARRLAGEPVERIVGRAGFWTLDLVVTPDTLSPRADTETVIRAAVEQMQPSQIRSERLHILDLGTGAGAILLALLAEFEDARGLGIDISEAALEVARTNAELSRTWQQHTIMRVLLKLFLQKKICMAMTTQQTTILTVKTNCSGSIKIHHWNKLKTQTLETKITERRL